MEVLHDHLLLLHGHLLLLHGHLLLLLVHLVEEDLLLLLQSEVGAAGLVLLLQHRDGRQHRAVHGALLLQEGGAAGHAGPGEGVGSEKLKKYNFRKWSLNTDLNFVHILVLHIVCSFPTLSWRS